jgi:hypothetical protein
MLPIALAALMGLCALAIVLAPLYAPGRRDVQPEGSPASGLADREAAAKAALQDVEFDYQLGNLAEDDYRSLRERYTRRALAALKGRYDRERALDEAIEAQVRAMRATTERDQGAGHANGHAAAGGGQAPLRGKSSTRTPAKQKGGRGKNARGRA